jgi:hypothetical protein
MDTQDLADLERRTVNAVGGDLRATLTALTTTLTAVYVAAAGDTRHALPGHAQDTVRAQLADTLKALADQDYADIRRTLQRAAAVAMTGGGEDFGSITSGTLPLDLRQALPALTTNMREDLRAAERLARHGRLERYGDLMAVLTAARKAANHADTTAVWVVHRAHNEGRSRAIERAASRGQQVYRMWRAERGACPSCLGYAGALATPGDPFEPVFTVADVSARPDGPVWGPPLHPHCLPGDALVSARGRITGATSRIFHGELVHFRTLGNQEFAATPNHPVLTDHGWIPVGQLLEGAHVVRHVGPVRERAADQDHHHMPARIEDVAEAFLCSRGVATAEVPVTTEDFHGDGAGSEIAVVGTNRRLAVPSRQLLRQEVFPAGHGAGLACFTRGRYPLPVLDRLGAPPNGVMGGGGETLPLIRAGLAHAREHGGAPAATLDAVLLQDSLNDPTGDGVALAESLLADPGRVRLDQVVKIWREPFSDHVYNLETEDGWYIGNGIVTHNCRCEIDAWTGHGPDDLDPVDLPYALRREAQRSVLTGQAQGSGPARARAADRLLDVADLLVPKTVQKRARKKLDAGTLGT